MPQARDKARGKARGSQRLKPYEMFVATAMIVVLATIPYSGCAVCHRHEFANTWRER